MHTLVHPGFKMVKKKLNSLYRGQGDRFTHRVLTPKGPEPIRLFLVENFSPWCGVSARTQRNRILERGVVRFHICEETELLKEKEVQSRYCLKCSLKFQDLENHIVFFLFV